MTIVMWVVAAYRRTHGPSRLAWSVGWRPPGAESAFANYYYYYYYYYYLEPTSTKPQAEILTLNKVNGCNDVIIIIIIF